MKFTLPHALLLGCCAVLIGCGAGGDETSGSTTEAPVEVDASAEMQAATECLSEYNRSAKGQLTTFARSRHIDGQPVLVGTYDGPTIRTEAVAPGRPTEIEIPTGACIVTEDRYDGGLPFLYVQVAGNWFLPSNQVANSFPETFDLDRDLIDIGEFEIADLERVNRLYGEDGPGPSSEP